MRKRKINIYELILQNVEKYIKKHNIDINNKNIGLGYSAGIDSSVLFYLLRELKKKYTFNIILIHVNYNLRGIHSIKDKELVEEQASIYDTKLYIKEIDKKTFSKNINLQLKARKDRYDFYKEIKKIEKLEFIMLAHHKDDLLETIIYKMCKGSGSNIVNSMKEKNGYFLRPLIYTYKNELEKLAKYKNIKYRTDESNFKDIYSRNKIRNKIIPMMTSVNSNAKNNIIEFAKIVHKETKLIRKKTNWAYNKCIVENNKLNISLIRNYDNLIINKILIKFLIKNNIEPSKKRIKEVKKIISSKKTNINALFDNKLIIKEYENILIKKSNYKKETVSINPVVIKKNGIYSFGIFSINTMHLDNIENINLKEKNKIYINANYPITIRQRKSGDFINSFPRGEKKLIKKILIENKVPQSKKNNIPIIEKNNDILALYMHEFGLNKINNNFSIKNGEKMSILCIEFNIL